MRLTIDFEGRSTIDIRKSGGYVYAEHPDTEVLCLAVKVDDGPTRVWIPHARIEAHDKAVDGLTLSAEDSDHEPHDWQIAGQLPIVGDIELSILIAQADVIEAHNASFERVMWREHMVGRRKFEDIPLDKWDDTAARAAMCALPRGLDDVCKTLGVKAQKDMEGYKLMLKMSKPRALRKSERVTLGSETGMTEAEVATEAKTIVAALKVNPRAPFLLRPDYHKFFSWHESPDDFVRLCQYCMQDVEAEYALSQELPELPPGERKVWELDQQINDRGVLCDMESVDHAEAIITDHEKKLLEEFRELTGMSSAKAVAAMKYWLSDNGCDMYDLRADTVKDALNGSLPDAARRVLEIRQSLSKSSTAKLQAFKSYACRDGRLRGTMMYSGAGTGRWTGKGPQPHNLPRGNDLFVGLQDTIFDLYPTRDADLLSSILGSPQDVVSSCLRGMLVPAPGHIFIASDYAAIEGRALAWIAGEQHVLDAYVAGKDLYKVAASGIYKIPYEQVDGGGKGKQRQVGKTAELACGYQGGWKAMLAFGADRLGMSEQEMKIAVDGWRESRPATVRLWKLLEQAAFTCVKEGTPTRYRDVRFRMQGKFLQMILPSGRALWYFSPRIQVVMTPWGEEKQAVTALFVDGLTKQLVRRPYHGGLWTENATQAMCRDVLVLGLFRCDKAGYIPVLHVHDEIVSEVPEGFGSVDEMTRIMSIVPAWAEGLPLMASGFTGKRYKKD